MRQESNKLRPRVWIVLVNWNGWRDTVECLESVLRLDYPDFVVIVCDNASEDDSLAAIASWASGALTYQAVPGPLAYLTTPPLPKPIPCMAMETDVGSGAMAPPASAVRLYLAQTGANLGFAGGNNVGIRHAMADPSCDYVWLLNNDTVVESDTLTRMVAAASVDSQIGMTGSVNCFYDDPEMIQALGGGTFSPARASGRLFGNGLRARQITAAMRQEAETQLRWVSGASMLVSRPYIEQIGLMEEDYFLYFEEIDWALRGRGRFRNALAYSARVYHKGGSSTGEQQDSAFAIYTMCRSRIKLYRKLMPELISVCYRRVCADMLKALLKGRTRGCKAMFMAARDELLERK